MTMSKPLTFGELKVGDKFIGFPLDGDDSGHGGFRKGSYLFEKTSDQSAAPEAKRAGNAKRIIDGASSLMPPGMKVLLVL